MGCGPLTSAAVRFIPASVRQSAQLHACLRLRASKATVLSLQVSVTRLRSDTSILWGVSMLAAAYLGRGGAEMRAAKSKSGRRPLSAANVFVRVPVWARCFQGRKVMATSHYCNGRWRPGPVADCDRHRRLDRKQTSVYARSSEPGSDKASSSSSSSKSSSSSSDKS